MGEATIKLSRGEKVLDPKKVEDFKSSMKGITIGTFLKESWHWILVILFAGVIGYIIGVKYCTVQCNNYILKECVKYAAINITNASQYSMDFLNLTVI